MRQAVIEEPCPFDLALQKLEPLNHLRWSTSANKILRLYVGLDAPSSNTKNLVTFIIRDYALKWLAIKTLPSCKDGAQHPHGMMVRTGNLR